MTIRKLSGYGTIVTPPENLRVLHSDLDIANAYLSGETHTACTVVQGSIAQSLGITSDHLHHGNREHMTHVLIDLLQVDFTTSKKHSKQHSKQQSIVVAGSLVLGKRTLLTTHHIISNSGILRGRDVLPRSHPNDGFVDVLEIAPSITPRQRLVAWHRAKTGSHLPHPLIRATSNTQFEWSGRPSRMVADGVTFTGVDWVRCSVLADAIGLYF